MAKCKRCNRIFVYDKESGYYHDICGPFCDGMLHQAALDAKVMESVRVMVLGSLRTALAPQSAIVDTIWVNDGTTLADLLAQAARMLGATEQNIAQAAEGSTHE